MINEKHIDISGTMLYVKQKLLIHFFIFFFCLYLYIKLFITLLKS